MAEQVNVDAPVSFGANVAQNAPKERSERKQKRRPRGKRGGARRYCQSSESVPVPKVDSDLPPVPPAFHQVQTEEIYCVYEASHTEDDQHSVMDSSYADRSVSDMYVKTKFCRFHGMGICNKGDACAFAHQRTELRPAPNFFCTKICPIYVKYGECCNPDCSYAHGKEEKRKFTYEGLSFDDCDGIGGPEGQMGIASLATTPGSPLSLASLAPSSPPLLPSTDPDTPEDGDHFFKTKLCKFFVKGVCQRTGTCKFAHISGELRPLPDLHCTRVCPVTQKHGVCTNARCTYAHSAEELRRSWGLPPTA